MLFGFESWKKHRQIKKKGRAFFHRRHWGLNLCCLIVVRWPESKTELQCHTVGLVGHSLQTCSSLKLFRSLLCSQNPSMFQPLLRLWHWCSNPMLHNVRIYCGINMQQDAAESEVIRDAFIRKKLKLRQLWLFFKQWAEGIQSLLCAEGQSDFEAHRNAFACFIFGVHLFAMTRHEKELIQHRN